MMKPKRRVVITGLGVIAPNGIGSEQFWQNTFNGESGIRAIDFAKEFNFRSQIGAPVKDFDTNCLTELESEKFDRYIQFTIAATNMALHESQLKLSVIDKMRAGVSIANAIGGTKQMEQDFLSLSKQGKMALNPLKVPNNLINAAMFNEATAVIVEKYDLQGPSCTIPTGCAAGLDAIGFAFDLIRSNEADVMIAGAAEAPITPMVMAAFDAVGALSSQYNHAPHLASRPFDKNRDGFVLAEGAGVFVLEELEHALARKAPILAEVCGYGSTSNAYHMTGLPEGGEDLARSIQLALNDAELAPEKIDYINAHGSSTPQNDANETAAYKLVFGKHAYKIPINSLKSMCGHALAAANVIEMAAAIGCLIQQCVYPTLNYQTPDPNCDLDYVIDKSKSADIQYLLKNASGFSGIHSALIISRFENN